ncbi:MAG: hypothetical protein IJN64_18880 [Lachnospiraceae bacterium]|nr:hypothetical protein [Lachnospiraceae bacterium]
MNKKSIWRSIFVLICVLIIVGGVIHYQKQQRMQQELAQQILLGQEYKRQNSAFSLVRGYSNMKEQYVGYEGIDQEELFVRLTVYNEWINSSDSQYKEVTMEDVKEYLSNQYNEDGSLRIYAGYDNIRDYMEWYYKNEGDEDIQEYWADLQELLIEFATQNPNIDINDVGSMSIAQWQELIKKKNDSSYEINVEIMKE